MYIYNDKVVQGGIKPSLIDMFISVASSMEDKVDAISNTDWFCRGFENHRVLKLSFGEAVCKLAKEIKFCQLVITIINVMTHEHYV